MNPCTHIRAGAMALGLLTAALPFAAQSADAPPPSTAFRTDDGAYLTTQGGELVDPYFVNKSMIMALESGMDIAQPLNDWLRWLMPHQRADGGFDRFCKTSRGWRACMKADADDSTAATTIQMVALAEQKNLLAADVRQPARKASQRARVLLDSLLDKPLGLYRVFVDQPTYYLMDNAEVHAALLATGSKTAAGQLAAAMRRQFSPDGQQWNPAIPPYEKQSFYPHALAQSYLWHGNIVDTATAGASMAAWLAHHSRRWLSRSDDAFAWGLVAWNLADLAPAEAGCWRKSVHPLPAGVGWTVLDAFANEALAKRGIAATCAYTLPPNTPPKAS